MKNFLAVFFALFLVLGMTVVAPAAEVTVEFENPPLSPAEMWNDQYIPEGVENAEHPWNSDGTTTNDVPPDGITQNDGWGGESDQYVRFNGPEIISGWGTTGGGGGVLMFSEPQTSVTFDVIGLPGTSGIIALNWWTNNQAQSGVVIIVGSDTWQTFTSPSPGQANN